jgi:hypothetical protein
MTLLPRLLGISLLSLSFATIAHTETKTVTWTGWFSDVHCARATNTSGAVAPNNPVCAKECIQKGTAPAFISEQAKAVFEVKDSPSVIDDLGYHLEVEAKVDEAAKTIVIQKVKRLEAQGASCGRKKKSEKK